MKNIKLSQVGDSLSYSYWFIPTLMAAIAIGLAFATLTLDRITQFNSINWLSVLYAGGPQGARALLSTIAGTVISVAATTFSIVIVALTLTSSQFGPRLLRNFMRDTGNKVVLGTFVATFLYCLLVLRSVSGGQQNVFVPQISTTVSMLLAIASIGVLIYFIQHAVNSIQAGNIINDVGTDLDKNITLLFPEKARYSKAASRRVEEIPSEQEASPILATGSGYIQRIDNQQLIKIATSSDLLVRLKHRPGKFIVQGDELVTVWPRERVNHKLVRQINNEFILSKQRDAQQDIEFQINQLVEIAVCAISPPANPFTVTRCMDQLSVALCHLAERDIPSPNHYDDNHKLRLIVNQVTFAGITDNAFDVMRQYGRLHASVIIRLLEVIATVAQRTRHQKQREVLLDHVQAIERDSREIAFDQRDRKQIEQRYQTAVNALEQ